MNYHEKVLKTAKKIDTLTPFEVGGQWYVRTKKSIFVLRTTNTEINFLGGIRPIFVYYCNIPKRIHKKN